MLSRLRLRRRARAPRPRDEWLAGALTGLITSTYSSAVVGFGARRLGRNPTLDWMHLGTVLLRGRAITVKPRLSAMLAGLVVHQSADIFWAAAWGRIAGPLGKRRQRVTAAAYVPWSLATAAVEYWLILPWLQPLVRMETPYWTAATVHLSSGAAYPLLPFVRERITGRSEPDADTARRAAALLTAALGAMAGYAGYARWRREPRMGFVSDERRDVDRWFLRSMASHHLAGVELAELAAERSTEPDLRTLGRLMLGEHLSELELMRGWWRSWYEGELPPPTETEMERMSGMPARHELDRLHELDGITFDQRFLDLMIPHHLGAIDMANREWRAGGDPRLRLFAEKVRHAQKGQVARMRRYRR